MGTVNFAPPQMSDSYYVLNVEEEWELEDALDNISHEVKEAFKGKYYISHEEGMYEMSRYSRTGFLSVNTDVGLVSVSVILVYVNGYYEGINLDMRLEIDGENFTNDPEGIERKLQDLKEDEILEDVDKSREDIEAVVEDITEQVNTIYGECCDLELVRLGMFSNGTAVYKRVDKKDKL